jgi:hypothetical protein
MGCTFRKLVARLLELLALVGQAVLVKLVGPLRRCLLQYGSCVKSVPTMGGHNRWENVPWTRERAWPRPTSI